MENNEISKGMWMNLKNKHLYTVIGVSENCNNSESSSFEVVYVSQRGELFHRKPEEFLNKFTYLGIPEKRKNTVVFSVELSDMSEAWLDEKFYKQQLTDHLKEVEFLYLENSDHFKKEAVDLINILHFKIKKEETLKLKNEREIKFLMKAKEFEEGGSDENSKA